MVRSAGAAREPASESRPRPRPEQPLRTPVPTPPSPSAATPRPRRHRTRTHWSPTAAPVTATPSLLLLLAAALAGCGTVAAGTSQAVAVSTDPPGAACEMRREGELVGAVAGTPGSAEVSKSMRDLVVRCERPGSLPAERTVRATFGAATLGNLILGGGVGLLVDAATGANSRYPEAVALVLPPARFASSVERDAFFAARADAARREAAAEAAAIRRDCPPSDPAPCEARVARVEADLGAALARLDAQRASVPVGDGAPRAG